MKSLLCEDATVEILDVLFDATVRSSSSTLTRSLVKRETDPLCTSESTLRRWGLVKLVPVHEETFRWVLYSFGFFFGRERWCFNNTGSTGVLYRLNRTSCSVTFHLYGSRMSGYITKTFGMIERFFWSVLPERTRISWFDMSMLLVPVIVKCIHFWTLDRFLGSLRGH